MIFLIASDQKAKEELSWWITNMKIYTGKSLLIVPPDLPIFSDALKKAWGASCQEITTGVDGLQWTKLVLTDRQHDSSLLIIKHRRHPQQTFNRNLERNFGLSHREKNTFDSRIYIQSEQSNSRLGIPKLLEQWQMETLPSCFQTNL